MDYLDEMEVGVIWRVLRYAILLSVSWAFACLIILWARPQAMINYIACPIVSYRCEFLGKSSVNSCELLYHVGEFLNYLRLFLEREQR